MSGAGATVIRLSGRTTVSTCTLRRPPPLVMVMNEAISRRKAFTICCALLVVLRYDSEVCMPYNRRGDVYCCLWAYMSIPCVR